MERRTVLRCPRPGALGLSDAIRRDEVEARVLHALQEKLLQQDLFEEFCDEFTREMNRLRMERRASLSSAKREIERISTRIKKLLNPMLDDEIAVDRRGRQNLTTSPCKYLWLRGLATR